MYRPPEVKWPDPEPDTPTTPEIQAQREAAAKAAEQWIEKRRIRYRLKAALIEALENHRDTGLTEREPIREAFGLLVGYTDKDTQAMAERLMTLLLTELDIKNRDGVFLAELAGAIEKVCEKDETAIRSAGDQDLATLETGRKWMGEVITASRDRPMSYFDRRAWQQMAARLGILIEMK